MIDASPATLLAVWDRAAALPIARRARALLTLATPADDVDVWTLGRRDAMLAHIFSSLYGDAVEATVRCRACNELLEFQTTIETLFAPRAADGAEPGAFCLCSEGYELTLRPLRSGDLEALPRARAQALECVLRRCVIAARYDGRDVDVSHFPASVRDAISMSLRDVDPQSEILITLACACCATPNTVIFDIGTFLWEALDRSVQQTVLDVHVLATAYGWTERDILALPEGRRRRYLELVGE